MIPTWLMVPITVSIVIGGVLYAIVMGAITGYFSGAVGMLFVISGIVGIVAAAFSRKALAIFFLTILVVVNVLALAVNIAGVVDPQFLTTMDVRDVGFMTIKPSVLWFLGGLAFMAIFCIPCITIAVVNVCTFRPRRPSEKSSRWRFSSVRTMDDVEMAKKNQTGSIPTVKPPTKVTSAAAGVRRTRQQARQIPTKVKQGPREEPILEVTTATATTIGDNPTNPKVEADSPKKTIDPATSQHKKKRKKRHEKPTDEKPRILTDPPKEPATSLTPVVPVD